MDGDGVPLGSYIPNESRRWKILAPILLWYLRDPCPVIEIRTHLVGISALFFRLRAFRFNPETPHQGLSEMEQEAINSTRFQYVSIPQTDTNDFCAGPFDILRPSQGQFSWPQSRLIGAGTHLQQNTRRTLSFFYHPCHPCIMSRFSLASYNSIQMLPLLAPSWNQHSWN
jgi:hypothetical protein